MVVRVIESVDVDKTEFQQSLPDSRQRGDWNQTEFVTRWNRAPPRDDLLLSIWPSIEV